ncbi:MAG TPA: helix-turn-helix transcriptional regulator [Candidatus Limnocylindrales bacterium]|nr:helix-turn-helix transcriptional regulator [Candidatus Limnocylindrales bacterium]
MGAIERLRTRGSSRARRILAELATDVREARLRSGLSQEEAGRRAGLSGDKVWKIEHERLGTLSVVDACRLTAVLGLDFAARTYENGARIRDAGQAPRLVKLLAGVGAPLRYRTDVPLPARDDAPELRAWDALLSGNGERTAVELEARLTDMQATARRHNLKRRDDPVEHFLLVVANTKHNRRVMREYAGLFADLPHLRTASVLKQLRAGKHPPTGWIFF